MFKGFVLSESLKNPTIINKFEKVYVKIETHPESKENQFWHLFKIKVTDKNIEKVTKEISKQLKNGWYAHLWNNNIVYICFPNKIFQIPKEKKWSSKEFNNVKEYGVKNGAEERYLDFWIED